MALNEQAKAWLESVAASGLPPLWQISVPDARATYQAVVAQCGGEPEPVTKREDRTIEGPGGPLGLRIYTPDRLPTHPTSFRARHVIAKPSRFLTPAAMDRVDVIDTSTPAEQSANRVGGGVPARPAPVTVPSMDDLFS